LINATEGLRLEVRSGCLWLTRPADSVDRFLVAGSVIELHENQVLIQSDRCPGVPDVQAASYLLVPLRQPTAHPVLSWVRRLGGLGKVRSIKGWQTAPTA
jgi:hypothetical protein